MLWLWKFFLNVDMKELLNARIILDKMFSKWSHPQVDSTRSRNDVWTEHLYYIDDERERRDDGKNDVYFKTKFWMHQFTFTNNLRLFLNRVVAVFITVLFRWKLRKKIWVFRILFTSILSCWKIFLNSPRFCFVSRC